MNFIDLIYRFDPDHKSDVTAPETADEALEILTLGNTKFAEWTDSCIDHHRDHKQPPPLMIPCSADDLGIPTTEGLAAKQAPFAILLGCSDARVPAETIFGLLRNNLFVVRVAGNVLSDEGFGSIEYAIHNLSHSIRLIVVLGHTSCGAVSAAVDTYLNPWSYLAKVPSPSLRSIVDRLLMPVRKAASLLELSWGSDANKRPEFRDALIETTIYINAIQTAFYLRQALEREGKTDVKVVFGIFDLTTHRVKTGEPVEPEERATVLLEAPATLEAFEQMAIRTVAKVVSDLEV